MTLSLKRYFHAFLQFTLQIRKDAMLSVCCMTPFLCGFVFRYLIPMAEDFLTTHFQMESILQPYYPLVDLLLITLSPMMLCFAGAMVMLGEIDDGISRYLAITPLNKEGYVVTRLGFPLLIAWAITLVSYRFFALAPLPLDMVIPQTLLSLNLGLLISMMVVSLSTNKVEGMATAKLSGLFLLGIPAPYFIFSDFKYALSFLPSFWLGIGTVHDNPLEIIIGILIALIWLFLLWKRFSRKLL